MENPAPYNMAANRPFTTKTEWVYQQLRARILGSKDKLDPRLRLSTLAQEFNISEMPVREALRMLQRDGLVRMESHRGATIVDLNWENAAAIVSMRMHLEILAVREATGFHLPESLHAIEVLLKRMDDEAAASRAEQFSQSNREFHTKLYAPGTNEALKEEIQSLWDRVWRARMASIFALEPTRMTKAQQEHRKIFAAVRKGDPDGAASAMEDHRSRTMASWKRLAGTERV
jgi:DNA-binding GntR family transcriptional regulator